MTHLNAGEKERILFAAGISLLLHFILAAVIMLMPGSAIKPSRPDSPPIHVEFEPLVRTAEIPLPEPPRVEEKIEEVRPEVPVDTHTVQPRPVPQPQRNSSSALSSTAPAAPGPSAAEEYPAWTPPEVEDVQTSFSSAPSVSSQGGRQLDPSSSSDSQALRGTTDRNTGALDESPVEVSSPSGSAAAVISNKELEKLDEAIAAGGSGSTGTAGSASGGVAEEENVGDIRNIVSKLSYRGAQYAGPPAPTADVVQELQQYGLTTVPVEISFTISPAGIITDLQTSAASIYPALDAFLRDELPEVLTFEPLPRESQHIWQQVNLELVVKSN